MSQKKDFRFDVGQSHIYWLLPCVIFISLLLLVVIGPFFWQAKLAFLAVALPLGFYYWRSLQVSRSFSQIRFSNGVLLLVFNNGQEPELIQLVGQQRVLPWLVELNFIRENGKRVCWGIAYDAMAGDQFRQLKVFIQAYHSKLVKTA